MDQSRSLLDRLHREREIEWSVRKQCGIQNIICGTVGSGGCLLLKKNEIKAPKTMSSTVVFSVL